jgi:altronate dehydratase
MQDTVVVINPADNVGVVTREVKKGETVTGAGGLRIEAADDIPKNHKIALADIPADTPVIKYGERIGYAGLTISAGAWVHTHNLKAEEG